MESGAGGIAPRAGEEIAAELIRRRLKINQDELEFSVLAAAYAHTNGYEEQGFDSPISWIKANCHMSGGAAGQRGLIRGPLGRPRAKSRRIGGGGSRCAAPALMPRASPAPRGSPP